MSLHLHTATSLDPLVPVCAELLRLASNPLNPLPVVVPSPSAGRWLTLRLAERQGTVLGIRTVTLETFITESLGVDPGQGILRREALAMTLLTLLRHDEICHPDSPNALFVRPGTPGDFLRRADLSLELARLLLEYGFNRPGVRTGGRWTVEGLERTWSRGERFISSGPDDPLEAVESWQRRLHARAFGPGGALDGCGRPASLPQHHARNPPTLPRGTKAVILFGIDKVSHFHRNVVLELAGVAEVHVCLVNPCREFWEDLDTTRRMRSRGPRPLRSGEWDAPELPDELKGSPRDPLLLRLWGRTGRENTTLWHQAVDYDVSDCSGGGAPAGSLLGDLQEGLRSRTTMASGDRNTDDGSIRILLCPHPRREMEAVRDEVLRWLDEDRTRHPDDVVILVPDPSGRSPDVLAAFADFEPGHPHHLHASLVGDATPSRIGEAVLGLMAMARQGIDRVRLRALIRNPCVQRRRGLSPSDIPLIEEALEASGALWGWDRNDRIRLGEDPAGGTDAHTFRTGLLRLLIGRWRQEPVDLGLLGGDGRVAPLAPAVYASGLDGALLAALADLLIDLHSMLGRFASPMGPADTANALGALLDGWTDPGDDFAETATQSRLRDFLEHLRFQETLDNQPMDLESYEPLFRQLLGSVSRGTGRAWSSGPTIAPLHPATVLPHGLVVLAGLDDGVFPPGGRISRIDLLASRRIVGDPDPMSEARHAALLAVLAARNRLVLSCTAHDDLRDEAVPPGAAILEFERALREDLGADTNRLRVHVALSEPNDPSADPMKSAPTGSVQSKLSRHLAILHPGAIATFLDEPFRARIRQESGTFTSRADDLDRDEDVEGSDSWSLRRRRSRLLDAALAALASNAGCEPNTTASALIESIDRPVDWEARSPEGEVARIERAALFAFVEGLLRAIQADSGLNPVFAGSLRPGRADLEPWFSLPGGRRLTDRPGWVLRDSSGVLFVPLTAENIDKPDRDTLRARLRKQVLAETTGFKTGILHLSPKSGRILEKRIVANPLSDHWWATLIERLESHASWVLPASLVMATDEYPTFLEDLEKRHWRSLEEILAAPDQAPIEAFLAHRMLLSTIMDDDEVAR